MQRQREWLEEKEHTWGAEGSRAMRAAMAGSSAKERQAAPPIVLATRVANASSTLPSMFSTMPAACVDSASTHHARAGRQGSSPPNNQSP